MHYLSLNSKGLSVQCLIYLVLYVWASRVSINRKRSNWVNYLVIIKYDMHSWHNFSKRTKLNPRFRFVSQIKPIISTSLYFTNKKTSSPSQLVYINYLPVGARLLTTYWIRPKRRLCHLPTAAIYVFPPSANNNKKGQSVPSSLIP